MIVVKFDKSCFNEAEHILTIASKVKNIQAQNPESKIILSISSFDELIKLIQLAMEMAKNKDKLQYEITYERINLFVKLLADKLQLDFQIFKRELDELWDCLVSLYIAGKAISAPTLPYIIAPRFIETALLKIMDIEPVETCLETAQKQISSSEKKLFIIKTSDPADHIIDDITLKLALLIKADKLMLFSKEAIIFVAPKTIIPNPAVAKFLSHERLADFSFFSKSFATKELMKQMAERDMTLEIIDYEDEAIKNIISDKISSTENQMTIFNLNKDICIITFREKNYPYFNYLQVILEVIKAINFNPVSILNCSSWSNLSIAVDAQDVLKIQQILEQRYPNYFDVEFDYTKSVIFLKDDKSFDKPGRCAFLFKNFGKYNINIKIAMLNFTKVPFIIIVDKADAEQSIRVLYNTLFSQYKTVSLVIFGNNKITQGLLSLIKKQKEAMLAKGINITVPIIANDTHLIYEQGGIEIDKLKFQEEQIILENAIEYADKRRLHDFIKSKRLDNIIFVDTTENLNMEELYINLLTSKFHIVSVNIHPNAVNINTYKKIHNLKTTDSKFLYGSGLSVSGGCLLQNIEYLTSDGDEILEIKAVFSSTLNWILCNYDGTKPFSSLVKVAFSLGLTQANPLEDLSGFNVAARLLSLGRLIGQELNIEDIKYENMVKDIPHSSPKSPEFWLNLKSFDSIMEERLREAESKGCVLRYVGIINKSQITAGIHLVSPLSHIALIRDAAHIVSVQTVNSKNYPITLIGEIDTLVDGSHNKNISFSLFKDIAQICNNL